MRRRSRMLRNMLVMTALCSMAPLAHSQQMESSPVGAQQSCSSVESYGLWDRTFGRRHSKGACIPGCEYPTAPVDPGQTVPPQTETPPDFDFLGSGAGVGSSVALGGPGGYLDSAKPRTTFRLRYESAYGMNRPDRAEFFYGKCGCFLTAPAPFTDPNAPGPVGVETNIDYQDIRAYFEYAFSNRFSAFIEAPVRFINPAVNPNEVGYADMNFGVKYAAIANCDRYLTFQFRVYVPTGDARKGLGTDHVSLEPGVLLTERLSDRWTLQAQVRDWIAIGGTDFAGNVLDYGVGLSYLAFDSDRVRVSPVVEAVGWSVLNGKALADGNVVNAAGDTIANAKFGIRIGLGCPTENGDRSDVYIGYGRALTGEVWYKDLVRVEYRRFW